MLRKKAAKAFEAVVNPKVAQTGPIGGGIDRQHGLGQLFLHLHGDAGHGQVGADLDNYIYKRSDRGVRRTCGNLARLLMTPTGVAPIGRCKGTARHRDRRARRLETT